MLDPFASYWLPLSLSVLSVLAASYIWLQTLRQCQKVSSPSCHPAPARSSESPSKSETNHRLHEIDGYRVELP
jgi:hypothetical protein